MEVKGRFIFKNPPLFKADKCIIEIEKVKYVDRAGEEDKAKEINIDIKEEYKTIKNFDNIAKLIAYKIFYSGKIGNIGVNIQKIQKDLAKLAERNKKLADEIAQAKQQKAEEVKQVVQEKIEAVKGTIDAANDVVSEALQKLRRNQKLPVNSFGANPGHLKGVYVK